MKIAIYGQYYGEDISVYIKKLFTEMAKFHVKVIVEEKFYNLIQSDLDHTHATFSNHTDLNKSFTMFITIGGDGTFLHSIDYVRDSNIAVLGLNVGRLGFLANVQKNRIEETVQALVKKEFTIIERSLLQVKTDPPTKELTNFDIALNEITVVRNNSTAMIIVETHLDDEFLNSYWVDGLIVATPTGSTGYSLSCGGPIIAPTAQNMILTPIAPHNLTARPLVIPDNIRIKLKVVGREKNALLSLDSRVISIPNNTTIHVEKATYSIKTISLNNQTFFKTLREKLLWGDDIRNTKF